MERRAQRKRFVASPHAGVRAVRAFTARAGRIDIFGQERHEGQGGNLFVAAVDPIADFDCRQSCCVGRLVIRDSHAEVDRLTSGRIVRRVVDAFEVRRQQIGFRPGHGRVRLAHAKCALLPARRKFIGDRADSESRSRADHPAVDVVNGFRNPGVGMVPPQRRKANVVYDDWIHG